MIDDDLRPFKLSCNKPYDRHSYRVTLKTGKKLEFEDYEMMRYYWYQMRDDVDHVDVIDCGGKGF